MIANRRRFLALAAAGSAAAGAAAWGFLRWRGSDAEILARGRSGTVWPSDRTLYPARRDGEFAYGRAETREVDAARYTNFYEFSVLKSTWRFVDAFRPDPWTVVVDGLCRNRLEMSVDELLVRFRRWLVERQYRHRCVERWAMAVPWTGVPLAQVLAEADPLPAATHVRLISFDRPEEAPNLRLRGRHPWPYQEGLTLAEATNPLVLLASGMYGHPLLKQHGAPLRLVVPWKYGYKSIKSVVRIELVAGQCATFWSTIAPQAYPFESNVDPAVSIPWPQQEEEMLGTGEVRPTEPYNGYGAYVAHLYPKRNPAV